MGGDGLFSPENLPLTFGSIKMPGLVHGFEKMRRHSGWVHGQFCLLGWGFRLSFKCSVMPCSPELCIQISEMVRGC